MADERTDTVQEADPETPRDQPDEPGDGRDDRQDDGAPAIDPEAAAALRDEWGADFAANLALAQDAVRAVADDALVDALEETGLGNDPRIIRAAARIGRLLKAGGNSAGTSPAADERDALEETLDELSRRPDYWSDRVQRRVRQIHLALHGDRPVAADR